MVSGSHPARNLNVDDCERVSRFVSHALDVTDSIMGSYLLEVSSPGLDRPLQTEEDYRRSVGKLIHVKRVQALDGNWIHIGRLQHVDKDGVEIKPEKGDPFRISWPDIAQARLEVEW